VTSHPPKIRKAVFPIAGLGTRFLPATKAAPKEMLTVVDKPLIQFAVEEAYAAGIRQMIFVTGRHKRAIEDHFDVAYELEAQLMAAEKHDLMQMLATVKPDDMDCIFIRQPRALGLGHAVLCAENLVGEEPFAVMLADDLMLASPGILEQMIAVYRLHACSLLAVQTVPIQDSSLYGMIAGAEISEKLIAVTEIVEKPLPAHTPSTLAVAGRYILSPTIFPLLKAQAKGAGGEVQLTDSIAALLKHEKVMAYLYDGQRFDCGSKLGLLQANVTLGLTHSDTASEFAAWLKRLPQ
jgi:UTP--glucose-1-phosphate uridylyltransferase